VTTPSRAGSGSFNDALASVTDVDGWMTDDQARRLWDRASALPAGSTVVEIGSFRGRSAIVLAKAALPEVEVVAIDPHAGNDAGPQEISRPAEAGQADHDVFVANLEAAGVRDRIRYVRAFSQEALDQVDTEVELLYIDGAHRYAPARDDIRRWGARVADGGTLLIHDSFSSIGVTFAILTSLLLSGRYRYAGRAQSMAEYRRVVPGSPGRLGSVLRQLGEMPWFVRNVLIKVLLVARLAPLTRLLGHRTRDWPY
jgi:predicted O-methyltransferase YrrM